MLFPSLFCFLLHNVKVTVNYYLLRLSMWEFVKKVNCAKNIVRYSLIPNKQGWWWWWWGEGVRLLEFRKKDDPRSLLVYSEYLFKQEEVSINTSNSSTSKKRWHRVLIRPPPPHTCIKFRHMISRKHIGGSTLLKYWKIKKTKNIFC